jgi:lambda family phage tail tape measure protein
MIEYNREIAAYQDQVNAARVSAGDQVERLKQENSLAEQRASLEMAIRNMRGQDQETTRAIFDLEQKRVEQLQAIRNIQDLPYDERLQREREVNDEIDRARTVLEGRAQAMRDEQNSFTTGWANALEQFRNGIQTQAQIAGEIFGKVTKGMEDAFVNFAKTGKLSFKDLFKSIVETILRSQVQNLLARAFSGGGGGGGILGNLFSAFLGGGRAAGGPVSAGRAYTVGESGPETFVPAGAGSIVPGTGATSVTYNINAVDASSFRSMIAQDPEFLFAVTEQGRRRQPSQRR